MDNRDLLYGPRDLTKLFNIGVDVDGVLANFQKGMIKRAQKMGLDFYDHHTQWKKWAAEEDGHSEAFGKLWGAVKDDPQFWINLPVIDKAHITFPVTAYITSRPVDSEVTREWLRRNGFPDAPVHTVDPGGSKEEAFKAHGIEVYLDDKPDNIETASKLARKQADKEREDPSDFKDEKGIVRTMQYPFLVSSPHNMSPHKNDTPPPHSRRLHYISNLSESLMKRVPETQALRRMVLVQRQDIYEMRERMKRIPVSDMDKNTAIDVMNGGLTL